MDAGGDRVIAAEAIGVVRRRRNERLDDEIVAERGARFGECGIIERFDSARGDRGDAGGGEFGKIGFVAVPAQQGGWVEHERRARLFHAIEQRPPLGEAQMIAPGDEREHGVNAGEIAEIAPRARLDRDPRVFEHCGLDIIGPVPRLPIIGSGCQNDRTHYRACLR